MFDLIGTFISTASLEVLMPAGLGAFFVLALLYKGITLLADLWLARDNETRLGAYSNPRRYHSRNGRQ
jgi:hypothetical protein